MSNDESQTESQSEPQNDEPSSSSYPPSNNTTDVLAKGVSSLLGTVMRDFDLKAGNTLKSQDQLCSAIDRLTGGRVVIRAEDMAPAKRRQLKQSRPTSSQPMSPPPPPPGPVKAPLRKEPVVTAEAPRASTETPVFPPPPPPLNAEVGGGRKRGREESESEADDDTFHPIFDEGMGGGAVRKTDKSLYDSRVAAAVVKGCVLPADAKAVGGVTEEVLGDQVFYSLYRAGAYVDRLAYSLKARTAECQKLQKLRVKDKEMLQKMQKEKEKATTEVARHRALLDKAHEDVASRNKLLKQLKEKYEEVVAYYEAELDRDAKICAVNNDLVADFSAMCETHKAECARFAPIYDSFLANHPEEDIPENAESEATIEMALLLGMSLGESAPAKTVGEKPTSGVEVSQDGGSGVPQTSTITMAADGSVVTAPGSTEHSVEKTVVPPNVVIQQLD